MSWVGVAWDNLEPDPDPAHDPDAYADARRHPFPDPDATADADPPPDGAAHPDAAPAAVRHASAAGDGRERLPAGARRGR